jgi:hypothetical protein
MIISKKSRTIFGALLLCMAALVPITWLWTILPDETTDFLNRQDNVNINEISFLSSILTFLIFASIIICLDGTLN